MNKGYARTSRGELHYREAGSGSREIVLLHSVSAGCLGFQSLLPLLATAGYRAVALDLMGYGRSDKRDSARWWIEDFADGIEEALAALSMRPKYVVAGHFSALVAVELAARAENAVQALVLDGMPVFDAQRRAAGRAESGSRTAVGWHEDGRHALAYWQTCLRLLRSVDPTLVIDASPPAIVREHYVALLETFMFEPNTMEAVVQFDIEQRLELLTAPVLICAGEHDWNRKHVDDIAARVPIGQVRIFDGVHPLHQLLKPDRAAEYERVLRDFFDRQKDVS